VRVSSACTKLLALSVTQAIWVHSPPQYDGLERSTRTSFRPVNVILISHHNYCIHFSRYDLVTPLHPQLNTTWYFAASYSTDLRIARVSLSQLAIDLT